MAQTAFALYEGFVIPRRHTGGCYQLTMVMNRFLREERNIETKAVVGYVTDGTDDILISHAWLEHDERPTDVTLAITDRGMSGTGALLVQGARITSGELGYLYHPEPSERGILVREQMLADPRPRDLILHKQQEHAAMQARAADPDLMKAYLDQAPADQSYEIIKAALQRRL